MSRKVERAYSERASEYIEVLGSVEDMESADIDLIAKWGSEVSGSILDAGCGPGHWTDFLGWYGSHVSGMDIVPEFVHSACERFPATSFILGDVLDMPFKDSSFGGILAWYSLIHMCEGEIKKALSEFFRVLCPGGLLLIGMFYGRQKNSFYHAVIEAFRWSSEDMGKYLESAGFQLISTHIRFSKGKRPHLAMIAQRLE